MSDRAWLTDAMAWGVDQANEWHGNGSYDPDHVWNRKDNNYVDSWSEAAWEQAWGIAGGDGDEFWDHDKREAVNNKETKMKLVLTEAVDDFIATVVRMVDAEVGGVGYARVEDNNVIVVDHAFLIPQEVSGASVDFADDAVAIAIEKAVEDDRLDDLRFSWHSHGNLGVGWSTTDEGGINDYLTGGLPWLASMVVNRDGDSLARLDVQGVPLVDRETYKIKEVQIRRPPVASEIVERAKAEIDEHVTKKVYTRTNTVRVWSSTHQKFVDKGGPDDETSDSTDMIVANGQEIIEGGESTWDLSPYEAELLREHTGKDPSELTEEEKIIAFIEIHGGGSAETVVMDDPAEAAIAHDEEENGSSVWDDISDENMAMLVQG